MLSEAACELIRRHIDSVGRLDLLLALYEEPGAAWSAGRMGRQMLARARWAELQLTALEAAGILRSREDGGERRWAYDPADAATAEAVQDLYEACRADRPSVTREIMRTRPSAAQAFSEAFRLRRRSG